ncbi:hypothetical protein L6164_025448 [Bauhinia variegata]|uniref:Uncharacterized protein n=1 Tax=Bauhinia variegata TaxID=167791 RepID=A0ACB9M0J3_BAUVA|nr:hypothetical protein L6164_025448 [Bauhinia variegata]
MGARTSNRKRTEECLSVNNSCSSPNSSDFRISKKARFSFLPQNPTRPVLSSNSAVARISRYPEAKSPLVREVHAPCRPSKFGFLNSNQDSRSRSSGIFEEEGGNDMGIISSKYRKAKSAAFDSFRYLEKGKEVIEVDIDSQKHAVSEDSSIEEVEIIEDGREGRSVVTDHGWQVSTGVVAEVQDLDDKLTDGDLQLQSTSSVVSELTNSNLKVDSTGKMLDSLPPSLERGFSSLHAYKKLIESVDKRSDKLRRLSFEIELNEKRRSIFELLRPKKELVEDAPLEPFVPLTKEEETEVKQAFSAVNRKKILVAHENSNIEITVEIFQCLRSGAWLNDEVINVYLELLKEREKREPQKFLKCHFFNTFFYKKLISGKMGYDFKSVRRWTSQRKLGYGLIECDKIFIPIHKELHWCLAIINKKDKKFQYLDSLKGMDNKVLRVLAKYFVDEVKDKSERDIDVSSWKQEFVEDLPKQENGNTCLIFG